jgi:hypothetical protein
VTNFSSYPKGSWQRGPGCLAFGREWLVVHRWALRRDSFSNLKCAGWKKRENRPCTVLRRLTARVVWWILLTRVTEAFRRLTRRTVGCYHSWSTCVGCRKGLSLSPRSVGTTVLGFKHMGVWRTSLAFLHHLSSMALSVDPVGRPDRRNRASNSPL